MKIISIKVHSFGTKLTQYPEELHSMGILDREYFQRMFGKITCMALRNLT